MRVEKKETQGKADQETRRGKNEKERVEHEVSEGKGNSTPQ